MKIAVIGGAGVRTVNFINGLIDRRGAMCRDEIMLYDTDEKRLDVIERLCRHAVARRSAALIVRAARDVRSLLTDADHVVTTIRVGGDRSRATDEAIALGRGVIGQETTGAGGFFMAARTFPVLLGYMEQIAQYAPRASVFNFTNPSGLVTQMLFDAGVPGVIGICDAPSSAHTAVAAALKIEPERLELRFAGLNHLSYIQSVRVDGAERLPALLCDRAFLGSVREFSIFDPDAFLLSGFLPNEYLYYYYHREQALKHMRETDTPRGRLIERVNTELFDELYHMDIDEDPEAALQAFLFHLYRRENSYMRTETGRAVQPRVRGRLEIPSGMGYAGVMLDCIEAMREKAPRHVTVNVPNGGALPFLAAGDVAELSCSVSQEGIMPLPCAPMPAHCINLIRTVKAYEQAASEAIRTCSRAKAIEALTLHPLVSSFTLAKTLVDDCRDAYRDSVTLV